MWAVVPAAGVGARMGAGMPKQYLKLADKTILEQTLTRLLSLPDLEKIVVAVSPFDEHWPYLDIANHPNIIAVDGGQERADSVLQAMRALSQLADKDDWVLVHDAARPCVCIDQVDSLIEILDDHLVGGLLGVPVVDTIKRISREYGVEATVDRKVLWRAQTPQVFRFGLLFDALKTALDQGLEITDESSAVELAGYFPRMVEGSSDNIKITRPEDLPLAEMIWARQSI